MEPFTLRIQNTGRVICAFNFCTKSRQGSKMRCVSEICQTKFQLYTSHNVTKNLTGHMMHVEGPQIYQINRQTNSFQNMCDMLWAKIDCLARKIDSLQQKKTPQNRG